MHAGCTNCTDLHCEIRATVAKTDVARKPYYKYKFVLVPTHLSKWQKLTLSYITV